MRRPLLTLAILLTLSLALGFATVSDTSERGRARTACASVAGACGKSCSRCPTTSAWPSRVSADARHGNPALVPHAFVY